MRKDIFIVRNRIKLQVAPLYWSEYLHVFIVLHRAHSRLLVSIQSFFYVVIKITTLHYFLHR